MTAVRQQLVLWCLILGLWCLLMLAFTGQLVFTGGLAWKQAFLLSLRDWLPWVLLAPAVAWLAFRFPFERGNFWLSVPIHIVACLLTLTLGEVIFRYIPSPAGFPLAVPGSVGWRGGPWPGGGPPDRPPLERPPGEDGLPGGPPPNGAPPGGPAQPGWPPQPGAQIPPRFLPGPGRFPAPERARGRFANGLINHARFNLPIYWIIVTLVRASTLYRRSEERERKALELESRLTEAKLEALRTQLHPHFLFNTLNAVSTLVHKDPRAADEMIANLSELLRATLETTEQEIPLRQELAFLDRYLEIQQVRFGDRLRIEKEIDAAALPARVPTLILQPLAENALRHGIEPQPGPGVLTIRALRQGDQVYLTVADNGPGIKSPAGLRNGIGLANTKARLDELYGQKARLVMTNSSEGGCSAQVQVPYHEAPQEEPSRPKPL